MQDEFVMPDREKLETICSNPKSQCQCQCVSTIVNGATIYNTDRTTPLTTLVDAEDVYVEGWGFFKVNTENVTIENPAVGALIEWCPVRKCYAATCFLDLRRIALCEF